MNSQHINLDCQVPLEKLVDAKGRWWFKTYGDISSTKHEAGNSTLASSYYYESEEIGQRDEKTDNS